MAQKFATFENGAVVGFYDAIINAGKIPAGALPITNEQWRNHIAGTEVLTESDGVVTAAPPEQSAESLLAAERARMKAYRLAIREELASRPVSESPNLSVAFPGAASLLAAVDQYAATLDTYHALRMKWENITIFERWQDDVTALFASVLGVHETWVDQLFRNAMAREAS